MDIEWEIEDGYVTGKRTQSVRLDDDEFEDYETTEEAMEFIEEVVQEEFNQRVGWSLNNPEKIKEKVKSLITKQSTR